MKILMLSSDLKTCEKGSATNTRMVQYGSLVDELHIVVFSLKRQKLSRRQIHKNVWVYPTNSRNKLLYVLDAFKISQKIISKNNFSKGRDLITCQDPFESGLVGFFIKIQSKLLLQIQVHTDFLNPYFKKNGTLNRLRVFIAGFTMPKADCIRAVSKRVRDSIVKRYGERNIAVVPIYVDNYVINYVDDKNISREKDENILREKYPQFDFIALMVSRLEREKDITSAIFAYKKVCETKSGAGLVIIGEGSERDRLKSLANELGISDSVIFEGEKNDVKDYYKMADVYLLSSKYEGYSMTLIEAALSKCPIVTTDVGIVGEVFNKSNSYICPVGDSDCIYGKICDTFDNKDEANKRAQKAYEDAVNHIAKSKGKYLNSHFESFKLCQKQSNKNIKRKT